MASSPGTPTTSAPFELSKLLKTPTPTTTAAPAAAAAATSSPATPPPSSSGASPPPLSSGSPFSYAPAVPPILHHHHPFLHRPAAAPNPNPSPGARVTQHLHAAAPIESAASQPPPSPSTPSTPPPPPPSPARVLSGKKPRGRRVGGGERAVHDVNWRMQGEAEPPQLEVTPITKYTSDPDLVLGRQIAVNRSYIVYGLKLGNIRVLNINTALRSLLRGHTQCKC